MRLTLEIPDEAHRRIKTLAAFHGMSMKDYVLQRTLAKDEVETDDNPLPTSPWRVKPEDMDETEWLMSNPWLIDRLKASREQRKSGQVL